MVSSSALCVTSTGALGLVRPIRWSASIERNGSWRDSSAQVRAVERVVARVRERRRAEVEDAVVGDPVEEVLAVGVEVGVDVEVVARRDPGNGEPEELRPQTLVEVAGQHGEIGRHGADDGALDLQLRRVGPGELGGRRRRSPALRVAGEGDRVGDAQARAGESLGGAHGIEHGAALRDPVHVGVHPRGAEALVVGHGQRVAPRQQAVHEDAFVLDAVAELARRRAPVVEALSAHGVPDHRALARPDPRRLRHDHRAGDGVGLARAVGRPVEDARRRHRTLLTPAGSSR